MLRDTAPLCPLAILANSLSQELQPFHIYLQMCRQAAQLHFLAEILGVRLPAARRDFIVHMPPVLRPQFPPLLATL